eukprot:gene8984-9157_t
MAGAVVDKGFGLKGIAKQVASYALDTMLGAMNTMEEAEVQHLLLAMVRSPAVELSPKRIPRVSELVARALVANMLEALMGGILSTLSLAEQQEVVAAEVQIDTWLQATVGSPMLLSGGRTALAGLPRVLTQNAIHCAVTIILQQTALEQVAGLRPLGDWKPLEQAHAVLQEGRIGDAEIGFSSWLQSNDALLRVMQEASDTEPATQAAQPLQEFAAFTCLLEGAHVVCNGRTHRVIMSQLTKQAKLGVALYFDLTMSGRLQLLDQLQGLSPFLFYYQDIVVLALQMAEGKPGPIAAEAAVQLLQERHSVFLSR